MPRNYQQLAPSAQFENQLASSLYSVGFILPGSRSTIAFITRDFHALISRQHSQTNRRVFIHVVPNIKISVYAKNQLCRCPTFHTKRAVPIWSLRRRPYRMKPTAVGFISLTTVNSRNYEFSFSPISVKSMSKYISLLKSNKAVGHDGLHAAFLKCSGDNMSTSLCNVSNACISSCDFPSTLKWADINPIYKKKDNLCKENYRSVNVLVVVSKVFERVLSDQLMAWVMAYFGSILNHSLSAYRAGYSCQHVILQLTEFWRQSLDKGNCVGTVAMDLSKAFDSMPHGLLIAKLFAYGVSKHACNLIINFLCNRRQRTNVMGKCSEWVIINRGVPQGSVLGPLLFKIFVNDLFYTDIDSIICNYTNDNHIVNWSNSVDELKVSLEKDAHRAFSWFDNNHMDANPDKFQCISLDRFGRPPISISVDGNTIPSFDSIKVLGVTLDNNLHYDIHISNLCSKASIQINAMKRIGKYLNMDCRIAMYKSLISSNFS